MHARAALKTRQLLHMETATHVSVALCVEERSNPPKRQVFLFVAAYMISM